MQTQIKQIENLEERLSALETRLASELVFESQAVETNNTTTNQDKINVTTSVLPAGTYIYEVSFGWSTNSQAVSSIIEFLVDGAGTDGTNERILKQELKDSAGNAANAATPGSGTDEKMAFTRSFIVSHATDAQHDVVLRWRTEAAGTEATMWGAVVKIKPSSFTP